MFLFDQIKMQKKIVGGHKNWKTTEHFLKNFLKIISIKFLENRNIDEWKIADQRKKRNASPKNEGKISEKTEFFKSLSESDLPFPQMNYSNTQPLNIKYILNFLSN